MTQKEFDNKLFDGEKQFIVGCYCGHPCKYLVSSVFVSVDQDKESWTDELFMEVVYSEGEFRWYTRLWARLRLMWVAFRYGYLYQTDINIRMKDAHKLADFIKRHKPVLEDKLLTTDKEIV